MKEIKLVGLDEVIYYDECDNGLKVYMWVNPRIHTYYATLSVKYGSIYDEFKVNGEVYKVPSGVAHFLEHLKFNESKDFTAHDYYSQTGCDTNAFTTFNYTNYQVFGSENPHQNITHLLDFVMNPYFTKTLVQKEKSIIKEEAKMGQDDPYTIMLFKHLENLLHNSYYKNVITGTVEDIKNITLEDILLVFNEFYRPDNMFLVITGNFNPYEVMEEIKVQENKRLYDKTVARRVIPKEKNQVDLEYEEINLNVQSRKIKIGLKIPKSNFKNFTDLEIRLYNNILLKANFGNTSDFKDELLQKEIISGMSYTTEIFDDYLIVILNIDSDYKEEVINLFTDKLNDLYIKENTFKRIKNASIASLILEFEDSEFVNSIIQSDILNYGDVLPNIKEIYENLNYDKLNEYISYFDITNKSIIVFNPTEKR